MIEFPWASAAIVIPLAGALLCGVMSARLAAVVASVSSALTAMAVAVLCWRVWNVGAFVESLGGWGAPLGIDLYADGVALLMVAMTTVVGVFITVFSLGYFRDAPDSERENSHSRGLYWSLWLVVWAAMHGIFLSSDLFNIYVCMEVVGIGSVALVAMAGSMALRAAMRYLLITLCGSLLYLLGVALIYGGWGMLDMQALGPVVEATLASEVALAAMALGLALKTALVPLHFWLPAAHANAPAPVSALLSALVVKASFYVLLRLWIDVFPAIDKAAAMMVLGVLGTVAIVWGSVQALRQNRLKMLVAYSTVAQLGYLFVAFAPASTVAGAGVAWHGVIYFAVAHGCAKGAMFLAAGAIAAALGDDDFSSMRGRGRHLAVPLVAFALAGIGLMGLPPSGGYTAKWLLLTAAARADQPVVAFVVTAGGLLAALYVFKVLYYAFARPVSGSGSDAGETGEVQAIPTTMMVAPLMLAIVAVLLGVWSAPPLHLLDIGLPFGEALGPGLKP